jgi:hypothetical protein
MTTHNRAAAADAQDKARASDAKPSAGPRSEGTSNEPASDAGLIDRLKDKAVHLKETVGEQAGHLTDKSSELAGQAKHKAHELADTARTAARVDQAGSARTTRRAGTMLVTTASAIGAMIVFKKYRQRRAQKNRWSWVRRVAGRVRRRR